MQQSRSDKAYVGLCIIRGACRLRFGPAPPSEAYILRDTAKPREAWRRRSGRSRLASPYVDEVDSFSFKSDSVIPC